MYIYYIYYIYIVYMRERERGERDSGGRTLKKGNSWKG